MLALAAMLCSCKFVAVVLDILLLLEPILNITLPEHAVVKSEGLSFFIGPRNNKPNALRLQDTTTKSQQPQQPDKVGTQITLLKTGCLEALLHLSTASSVIVRIQVIL